MRRVTYFSLLLLSALVCGALLYGAYAVARQEAQRNLQTQQGILARQAAQGIQDYFAHSRALTYSLAQNQHVIELDGEGRQLLTNILADNTRELQAITRVDKHGIIMFSVPNNSVAGRNVSGQDHVARLLATHKPTASDVFASVQGYNAIALHVPVLRKGEFHGTLAILVDFDAIARRYLEPVRVSESGYAFVYSREGVLLYSPVPGLTGRHYTEITAGFPQLRATVEAMLRGESGEGSFAFDRVRDGTPTRVNKLAVYLPIPLEDTFWAICVATPEAVILARLMRFGLYLLPLGLAVLVFTAFGVSMGLRQFVLQREVNRRRETEAALRESEERYRSVIENISDVFYRSDAEGRLTMISPSGAALAGYASVEEILGMNSDAFWRHPKERRRMLEIIAKDGAVRDYEVELLDKSGRIIHVATSSNFYRDKDGNILGVEGIFRDISERKRMEEQLLFRALHDPLTGLANRSLCLDRIAQAAERARRKPTPGFAVVFMDLDRFKLINDSLGHEAGDKLLREVADRLLICTRRMDTVCRYGGDEFAMVLEDLPPRAVLKTLRRIRESLKTPMAIGAHNIQVEASFGVAYPPPEHIDAEEILRNANIALHRAKQLGRNRMVVFKQSMHRAAIQTMNMENDIRRGLALDEFFLLYQPIFDLNESRLVGFEALLRWRHPSRGLVSPAEFIPVAEESGSIFELGGFALEQACREMAQCMADYRAAQGLTVSVNLSPRQFSRQGLAEQIDRALADSGLPPNALILEITESSIMKHPEASAYMLTRLKARGVGIALDDFGTGYSSLTALRQLPLDRLKIDTSFVSRLTQSKGDREIVGAAITIARSLRLACVAEGVETVAQRDLLRELGCELGQGFLCAPALPLAEALRALDPEVCELADS